MNRLDLLNKYLTVIAFIFLYVSVLEGLRLFQQAMPKKIQVDNGSEIISKDLDRWAYEHQVELVFSRPGNQQIIRILSHSMDVFGTSA
ncbi:hypothetical protein B0I21_11191 [Sphingobacterium paludis]|uniref:Uncharacterized protein n=2 Tax=Sphingobacterium paludis TaxID=1476465 RepID=A0A4R7CSX5_9SPHI|nr:hypothetical protein B0I21_11191 [Sphingobacterium paludis]